MKNHKSNKSQELGQGESQSILTISHQIKNYLFPKFDITALPSIAGIVGNTLDAFAGEFRGSIIVVQSYPIFELS